MDDTGGSTELNTLAEKIFSLLKGNGLKIKIYDEAGSDTPDPTTGRRFFVFNPNIMITINDSDDQSYIEISKGPEADKTIVDTLTKKIKDIGDEFFINLRTKVFGKAIKPRDFAYQAKMEQGTTVMENGIKPVNNHLLGIVHQIIMDSGTSPLTSSDIASILRNKPEYQNKNTTHLTPVLNQLVKTGKIKAERPTNSWDGDEILYSTAMEEAIMEGFSKMFGSLKSSQQTLENVKILVRHRTPIDENIRGSRSRQISAIFLECDGERRRFPFAYLPGARAMAQHMAHGGAMDDKVGAYITESTGQLLKLQSFNRYVTTNKLINEDSSGIVETVNENIQTLRTELKKLTGTKTYETVKARIETFERETLAEDDVSQLKDLFTIRRFDEKFEEVLPIVKQLIQEKDTFHKRIEEAAGNVVLLRRDAISTTPMFEFASENAEMGFKINELALRIVENDELAGFVNKIGTKLCKEGVVNEFERAVLRQVLENAEIAKTVGSKKQEIKESAQLSSFFDKYDYNFF